MKKTALSALIAVSSLGFAQNIHVHEQGKVVSLPANAPVMTRQAYAQRASVPSKPLHFDRNHSARLTGFIRGLNMASYHFHGEAGQRVQFIPNGRNYAMEFALFSPRYGMNFGTVHTLPHSGEYEVRIVQTRQNAARNRKSYRYDVTVRLGSTNHSAPRPVAPRPVAVVTPSPRPVAVATPSPRPVVTPSPVAPMFVATSTAPKVTTGKKRTFRCQSGGSLNLEFFNSTSSQARVIVHLPSGSVNLQMDNQQSDQKNAIFTGQNYFLHMIRKGNDVSNAEILSLDAQKPLAFGCK